MKWTELLLAYLKNLLNYWYVLVFGLFDIIGVIFQDWLGWNLPRWTYGWVFIFVFGIANILVYRDIMLLNAEQKKHCEEKIIALKSKIAEISNTLPSLFLFFSEGEASSTHEIIHIGDIPPKPDFDKLTDQEIKAVEEAYEKLKENPEPKPIEGTDIYLASPVPNEEDFSKSLKDYSKKFRDYLEQFYRYELTTARFRSLKFVLENSGSSPGEDIRFFVQFPKEFKIKNQFDEFDDDDIEILLEPPPKSSRPISIGTTSPTRSIFELMSSLERQFYPTFLPPDIGSRPASGPQIHPTDDGYEVIYTLNQLQHNFVYQGFKKLEFLYLGETAKVLYLPYQIHAANLPNPQKGILTLEFLPESEKDQ